MQTQIFTAPRVFHYSGLTLPDPDPNLTPSEVRDYYQLAYPELVNATVDRGQFDGDRLVFVIRRAVGTKG